jgi:hypothetical protein
MIRVGENRLVSCSKIASEQSERVLCTNFFENRPLVTSSVLSVCTDA